MHNGYKMRARMPPNRIAYQIKYGRLILIISVSTCPFPWRYMSIVRLLEAISGQRDATNGAHHNQQ